LSELAVLAEQLRGAAAHPAERRSRNPLALRLVAQTVREVFDGDICAFLKAEAPIFDDIGTVLDQQVTQLSALERELRGHSNAIEMVRFSPDGRRLYSASKDETVREWDLATGVCVQILRAAGPYAGLDITGATGLSDSNAHYR
jgi:WD40 repeat protein